MDIELWAIERLKPNALNPRGPLGPDDEGIAELADSIVRQGLLQPIIATPAGLIVAGHRRHAACLVAKLSHVFVSVKDIPENEQFEIMLVENMQRADLKRLQLAHAYQHLQQSGLAARDIATKLSVSFASVQKHLDILRLPKILQEMFNELPLGYIPSLIELDGHPEIQISLVEKAAAEKWEINRMMSEAHNHDPDRPKSSRPTLAERGPGPVEPQMATRKILDAVFEELKLVRAKLGKEPDFAAYVEMVEELEGKLVEEFEVRFLQPVREPMRLAGRR